MHKSLLKSPLSSPLPPMKKCVFAGGVVLQFVFSAQETPTGIYKGIHPALCCSQFADIY